jgi:hypothetical protein
MSLRPRTFSPHTPAATGAFTPSREELDHLREWHPVRRGLALPRGAEVEQPSRRPGSARGRQAGRCRRPPPWPGRPRRPTSIARLGGRGHHERRRPVELGGRLGPGASFRAPSARGPSTRKCHGLVSHGSGPSVPARGAPRAPRAARGRPKALCGRHPRIACSSSIWAHASTASAEHEDLLLALPGREQAAPLEHAGTGGHQRPERSAPSRDHPSLQPRTAQRVEGGPLAQQRGVHNQQRPARRQMERRVAQEAIEKLSPVGARFPRPRGAARRATVQRGHVRRVGDDQVKALVAHGVQEIPAQRAHAHAVCSGL